MVKADAYQKPRGHEGAQAPLVVMPGAGFSTGAGVNAGVSLLAEGVNAVQQSNFEKKYAAAFDRVAKSVPGNVGTLVTKEVEPRLKKHPFFGPRVKSVSPNRIEVTITRHGFVRCGKRGSEVLVSPSIYGSWRLASTGGASAYGSIAAASPNFQKTLDEFAANPASIREGYRAAAVLAAESIMAELDKKAGSGGRASTPAPATGYAKASGSSPERLADLPLSPPQPIQQLGFTRGYNRFINQPTQKYRIGETEYKIAATPNGGTLFVMLPSTTAGGNKTSLGDSHYRTVRAFLQSKNIRIARERQVKAFFMPTGYILELTGDGYAALAPYRQ
ncbi:hypothetical protein Hsar01_02057 [Haloferula sargassicola]|uniref:Halobacterial output domain-containing protein n=1 Tax=Haloferula sargassicola TaxID=490096 RepID=A0ABP9UMM3_9BACT